MPKTKKVVKKATKIPKPSAMLAMALALFGKNGENWIQGAEKQAGFIDREDLPLKCKNPLKYALDAELETKTRDEVDEIITGELRDQIDYGSEPDPMAIAKAVTATAKTLAKRFIETPAHQAFCSIGAVCQINTPNEEEAGRWLAHAISPKDMPKPKTGRGNGRETIIQFNDASKTTWPMVKAAFQKASKLAKAAGR